MSSNRSVEFFDRQFERQVRAPDFALNPFEQAALPHLRGRVLDFGCGLGNLALAAVRAGCSVLALDASEVAIAHLRRVAAAERLDLDARVADLSHYALAEEFDTIASIGLLMFFDCATAARVLDELQAHVRPGGTLVVNVLVEGTTYMDMFDRDAYCLFPREFLPSRFGFAGWDVISSAYQDFAAPGATLKSFSTVVARRPR
jgi:tellurite methyltransferase